MPKPKKQKSLSDAAQKRTALDAYGVDITLKLTCESAAEDYQTKQKKHEFLNAAELPSGGGSIATALTKSPNFKIAIETAMKIPDAKNDPDNKTLEDRINLIKLSIEEKNKFIVDNPTGVSSQVIADELELEKQLLSKHIKIQQKEEIGRLESYFNANANANDNEKRTALGLPNPPAAAGGRHDIDDVKKSLITALKKEHTEQLKTFEGAVNADITNAHKTYDARLNEIAYLARMNREDPQRFLNKVGDLGRKLRKDGYMQAEINKNANKQSLNELPTISSGPANTQDKRFRGLKPEDMVQLETETGRKIQKSKLSKDETVFTIELPGLAWYKSFTNWYSEADAKKDIHGLIAIVRGSGFTTIDLTIEQNDEKLANTLAREAYRAALEAGFDPDDISITLKINGKDKTFKGSELDSLFSSNPNELANIKKKAAQTKQVYKDYKQQHLKDGLEDIKKTSNALQGDDRAEADEEVKRAKQAGRP